MNHRIMRIFLVLAITAALLNPIGLQATVSQQSTGTQLTAGVVSPVGGNSATSGAQLTSQRMVAPGRLTRADYQNLYNDAAALLQPVVTFRSTEIQSPLTGDRYGTVITDLLYNYRDFNNGTLFYKFCRNYDQINIQGYCPTIEANNENLRNKALRALQLFAVLTVADPADTQINTSSGVVNVREVGRAKVMETLRELVYVHMIFGNEFMVDALDYRFSDATLHGDPLIMEEITQLEAAVQQFELAVDVMVLALNADIGGAQRTYLADFFTPADFERLSMVSERLIDAIDQLASRYRQQRKDAQALALYEKAAKTQYAHAQALAAKAQERGVDFLQYGGWQLMNNFNGLYANAKVIQDGLNPFGFAASYVPLYTFDDLYRISKEQFLVDASNDEDAAHAAQRQFDQNRTALNTELQNLRTSYDAQLQDMCGASTDNFASCEHGLMEQNYLAMVTAADQIRLVKQRLSNIPAQIQIEEERSTHVISITVEGGQQLAVHSYAIGVRNSYRETKTMVNANTTEWYIGIGDHASISYGNLGLGWNVGTTINSGYKYSRTKTTSVSHVWDTAQVRVGELNGLRDVQNAATNADITGANSAAVIKNLLLQQADLLIELDLAFDRWNQLSAEHNNLVEKYHNLLGLRARAQQNLIDSYLNNPVYRIYREAQTLEAARSLGLTAQYAYLTAKALEYDYLEPVGFLNDIFKARIADDIDNFLLKLFDLNTQRGGPGQRNRFPYRLSLAKDLLGLSDKNLDPNNTMTSAQRSQLRYTLFQEILRQYTTGNVVEIPFTTSLLINSSTNSLIFTSNVWNNRIAGVNLPANVPNTQGVSLNLLTRQFGDLGTPELIIKHGGQSTYRTKYGAIVEYTPGPLRLVGYEATNNGSNTTTAVILSSVNGNGRGQPTSALFNLSVAASSWAIRIDRTSPFNANLDLAQIEDIELLMDTTGIALPARQAAAKADARLLTANFVQARPASAGQ